jgi:putative transcriptional regulator
MYYFNMPCQIHTVFTFRPAFLWMRSLFALMLTLLLSSLLPAGASSQEVAEPRQGMLLVADRGMQDPRFQESVILLLQAGPGGAGGVIINMPTSRKLSSIFEVVTGLVYGNDPLYYGGPVGGYELLMLRRANQQPAGWASVIKNVFITNSHMSMLDALMVSQKGDEVRVFAGYAGWARGQLEHEIRRGDWHLLPADAARIFRSDTKKLWIELFRKSREIFL